MRLSKVATALVGALLTVGGTVVVSVAQPKTLPNSGGIGRCNHVPGYPSVCEFRFNGETFYLNDFDIQRLRGASDQNKQMLQMAPSKK
jgi:hypothetical protein